MRNVLHWGALFAIAVGFGACGSVDELDEVPDDWDASDADTDTDTDTDADTDTDTDTDIDTDTDTDTDTDVPDYNYNTVCCDAMPATCADISDVTAEQEAGCCFWSSSGDSVFYCSGGELHTSTCSPFCGYDSGTEKMACLDIPAPPPCFYRDATMSYWDSEFPEFPVGTICCDSLPTTCADIAATPEAQFVGCCEAGVVHWCSGGELHSNPCGEEGTCAWTDNGLMWCDSGFVTTASPCPSF